MIYYCIVKMVKIFFYCLFWPIVKGRENIPTDGGYIISANHKSNYDPIFTTIVQNKKVYFLAKEELFSRKPFGSFLLYVGAYPLKRGASDIAALRVGIALLKDNKPLTVYPQGTRSEKIDLTKIKTGVALLAVKSRVPVLPIGIDGKYVPFHRMKLIIGKPMYFDEYYDKKLTSENLQLITVSIMKNIQSLVGEE